MPELFTLVLKDVFKTVSAVDFKKIFTNIKIAPETIRLFMNMDKIKMLSQMGEQIKIDNKILTRFTNIDV